MITAQQQPIDESQRNKFTWKLEDFSKLNIKKLYSDTFTKGGCKWRVLIFPKGNNKLDNVVDLSIYLDAADSATLSPGWKIDTKFSLAVLNQYNSNLTIRKGTEHSFNNMEGDWGFKSFMPLKTLYDPKCGFLVNDTCIIEVDVLETLDQSLAKVESDTAPQLVPVTDGRKDPEPPTGTLAAYLLKKTMVLTMASQDTLPTPPGSPFNPLLEPVNSTVPDLPVASSDKEPSSGDLILPIDPSLLVQEKDCIAQAIRLLEPHVVDDFVKIDNQAPNVIAEQALKTNLESFVGMHRAIEKFTIQLNSQSKKLEDLLVANNSLSVAKVEAEEALIASEEKGNAAEAKITALKAELERVQAEKLSWEDQMKTQAEKFEAATQTKEDELAEEKASRALAIEDGCQKARDKALDEFGTEVGGLVNQYHLACHIRSLTLAGLEPRDPRWYDVIFPIDGPTPLLKFPWEDKAGCKGDIPE